MKKAIDDFNSALILCKDYSEIWYLKADSEHALGKLADSIKSYEMVVKLEEANYDAWYDYGCALLDAKLYEQSLKAFDKVIKYNSAWAEPYYEKSKIYFLIENIEMGILMLEKHLS